MELIHEAFSPTKDVSSGFRIKRTPTSIPYSPRVSTTWTSLTGPISVPVWIASLTSDSLKAREIVYPQHKCDFSPSAYSIRLYLVVFPAETKYWKEPFSHNCVIWTLFSSSSLLRGYGAELQNASSEKKSYVFVDSLSKWMVLLFVFVWELLDSKHWWLWEIGCLVSLNRCTILCSVRSHRPCCSWEPPYDVVPEPGPRNV